MPPKSVSTHAMEREIGAFDLTKLNLFRIMVSYKHFQSLLKRIWT